MWFFVVSIFWLVMTLLLISVFKLSFFDPSRVERHKLMHTYRDIRVQSAFNETLCGHVTCSGTYVFFQLTQQYSVSDVFAFEIIC